MRNMMIVALLAAMVSLVPVWGQEPGSDRSSGSATSSVPAGTEVHEYVVSPARPTQPAPTPVALAAQPAPTAAAAPAAPATGTSTDSPEETASKIAAAQAAADEARRAATTAGQQAGRLEGNLRSVRSDLAAARRAARRGNRAAAARVSGLAATATVLERNLEGVRWAVKVHRAALNRHEAAIQDLQTSVWTLKGRVDGIDGKIVGIDTRVKTLEAGRTTVPAPATPPTAASAAPSTGSAPASVPAASTASATGQGRNEMGWILFGAVVVGVLAYWYATTRRNAVVELLGPTYTQWDNRPARLPGERRRVAIAGRLPNGMWANIREEWSDNTP